MSAASDELTGVATDKENILRGLNKLRNECKLTDVTLLVENVRFKAHRVVLAASSDYFCAMFAGSAMIESRTEEIELHGVSARAIGAIIDYIYTSALELNVENIEELLAASTHVQVKDVIERCTAFLEQKINMDNCLAIASLGDIYSQDRLAERAYRFICAHFKEFASSSDFKDIKVDQLRYVLSCNFPMDVSEHKLVQLLCVYGVQQKLDDAKLSELWHLVHWNHITYKNIKSLRHIVVSVGEGAPQILPVSCYYRLKKEYLNRMKQYPILSSIVDIDPVLQGPVNVRGMELSLLKIGGFEYNGLTNGIMCFSPSLMKWFELTTIPHLDQCNYGTAVLKNELFIVGGAYDVCLKEYIHPFGFRYCPLRNHWDGMAQIQLDRCRFSLNAVGEKHLYAVGGIVENDDNNSEDLFSLHSNVERYDVETNKWTYMPKLVENRSQHAGVTVGSKLYISGGIHLAHILSSLWCFDTETEKWEELAPMPRPCCDHVLVNVGNRIYSCGGWYENVNSSRVLEQCIYVYDIKYNFWDVETQIPSPKFYSGVSVLRHTIFFVGGLDPTESIDRASSETMAYDVKRKTWWRREDWWDTPTHVWEATCVPLYVPSPSPKT
ncbi:kelch-like protein 26 [Scaptodrosophila lebanonensis]|uniref:Kelch-like protein diablo n=1 Tax=Drosophila lebanonensis TaxID=7225 RepID=A0A6J2TTW9_DROLE|nr:kelch-like protein 26 [Scaptodrosophila lebanonensis]XP_030379025.1 kelch-like protein 26 [Scaptodrosophila lebanonensis]